MIDIFTKTFYKLCEICTGRVLKTTKLKTIFKTRNNLPGSGAKFLIGSKRSDIIDQGQ